MILMITMVLSYSHPLLGAWHGQIQVYLTHLPHLEGYVPPTAVAKDEKRKRMLQKRTPRDREDNGLSVT